MYTYIYIWHSKSTRPGVASPPVLTLPTAAIAALSDNAALATNLCGKRILLQRACRPPKTSLQLQHSCDFPAVLQLQHRGSTSQ